MAKLAFLVDGYPAPAAALDADQFSGVAAELVRLLKNTAVASVGNIRLTAVPSKADTINALLVALNTANTAQSTVDMVTAIGTGSAAGPNATTATITGILATSTLVKVLLSTDSTHVITDVTSHYTVTSANTVTSDADHSTGHIIVVWKNEAV